MFFKSILLRFERNMTNKRIYFCFFLRGENSRAGKTSSRLDTYKIMKNIISMVFREGEKHEKRYELEEISRIKVLTKTQKH